MNQEKTGKFIASLRKKNNLTQEQLADKLSITKNAVSKWERGLGLMDLSLLQPLSEILNVSVTELLNGEQANEDEINPKNETTLLNTIDYASKEVKKTKKHKKIIAPVTILITIILLDTVQAIVFKKKPYYKLERRIT